MKSTRKRPIVGITSAMCGLGGGVLKLGQHLEEVTSNDIEEIPFMLCVTTNVTNLGRATEKYFGLQANYVKVSLYLLHW